MAVQTHCVPEEQLDLGEALKPVIGYTKDVPITIDIASVVPAGVAVAQNIIVTSFDGTKILTHFFPASNLAAYQKAPTILDGPGLAQPATPTRIRSGAVLPASARCARTATTW